MNEGRRNEGRREEETARRPSLVLHAYWRSSSAYRVRLALGAKGLAYETVAVDLLAGAHEAAAYRELNPAGYVPCLLVDGVPFVESVAICELLEELFPDPPLLPESPLARARVRALVETVNAGTQPLQNLNVLRRVSDDAAARNAWAAHFIGRGLAAFEEHLSRLERTDPAAAAGPFCHGSRFGLADAFLVPQVYNARRFGVDLEPLARVRRADDAARALDFVSRAAPEAQADARPA